MAKLLSFYYLFKYQQLRGAN